MLRAVADRDAYANLLLPAVLAQRGLSGRDAALATELSYGTLRGLGTYDAVLGICSDRDLGSLDPDVREVLRLGTHQLLATRVAAHAAVATSVDLVRDLAGPRPAGFVNAVLRRVATRDLDAWLDIAAPDRAADPAGHLAVRYSHPRWIVAALSEALGEDLAGAAAGDSQTEAVLAADNERPRVTVCAVPGLASAADLTAAGATPARWSEFGAYLGDGDPAAIPAVAGSRAGVQDEASQLAAIALTRATLHGPARHGPAQHGTAQHGAAHDGGAQHGTAQHGTAHDGAAAGPAGRDERWLDLCAGPGGKARLLAGLAARTGARLVAAELRPHRARLVQAALSAWDPQRPRAARSQPSAGSQPSAQSQPGTQSHPAAGSSPAAAARPAAGSPPAGGSQPSAQSQPGAHSQPAAGSRPSAVGRPAAVLAADGRQPAWQPGSFDRVLADVPCSGLGALRRRPEARWRRSPESVARLGGLQRQLLATALDAARPGGVVAYVTCSPHLAETRDVLASVLAARDDIEVLDAPATLPEVPGLACPAPHSRYAQFWPHRHGTDAIFLALLRRRP